MVKRSNRPRAPVTHAEKTQAGRRMVSVWLMPEHQADLIALMDRWGIASVRDVIATALRECAKGGPHAQADK